MCGDCENDGWYWYDVVMYQWDYDDACKKVRMFCDCRHGELLRRKCKGKTKKIPKYANSFQTEY